MRSTVPLLLSLTSLFTAGVLPAEESSPRDDWPMYHQDGDYVAPVQGLALVDAAADMRLVFNGPMHMGAGKTTVFNLLTGLRQKVANYPGVTVERKEGRVFTQHGKPVRLLDLGAGPELGFVVFATDFERRAIEALSDAEVAAVSGAADPERVYEICERMHDRALIGDVHLGLMPFLVKHYGTQWSGAWTLEALQSPDKPYVVRYLELLREGRYEEATALYWDIKPAYDALMELMAPMLPKGVHPGVQLKYYQWCVGGNGGLPRLPSDTMEQQFPLTPEQRKTIKAAYRAIGIEPQGPEESFIVGRAAYERGVRAEDLTQTPMYVPG